METTANAPKRHVHWVAILIALAVALALIGPALPGGPGRPKPVVHARTASPEASVQRSDGSPPAAIAPTDVTPPASDDAERLWPAIFFFGANAVNSPVPDE